MTMHCLFRGTGNTLKFCSRGFLYAVHSLFEKLHFAGVEGGIHVVFIDFALRINIVRLQALSQHGAHIDN
jgi:hypothetical protein